MRYIETWCRQHEARSDCECERCGSTINAHSIYLRQVGVNRDGNIHVIKEHLIPECAKSYQSL